MNLFDKLDQLRNKLDDAVGNDPAEEFLGLPDDERYRYLAGRDYDQSDGGARDGEEASY